MKKKMIAMLMTMIMLIMAMSTCVSAATDGTYDLTIRNTVADTGITIVGKNFEVYQLFTAEAKGDSAIEYTLNSKYASVFTGEFGAGTEYATVEQYLDSFAVAGKEQELATLLKDAVASMTADYIMTGAASVTEGIELASVDVAPGYYLVLDATDAENIGNTTVLAPGVLTTVRAENVTVDVKASKPTIDKEIKHNDDNAWDSKADHQIGDTVEFKIKATVPSNITGYKNYTYKISDTMSEGLEYVANSIGVYSDATGNTTIADGYTLSTEVTGKVFELKLNNEQINAFNEAASSKPVTFYIMYNAILTEDAAIFNKGDSIDNSEDNTVTLEYSNNPFDEDSKAIIEDKVYAFTFDLDFFKTMSDEKTALAGAEFSLAIKGNPDNTPLYLIPKTADGKYSVYAVTKDANAIGAVATLTTTNDGKFRFEGLDDEVTYVLTETKAPEGYNIADPIEFKINKATYDDTGVPTITVTGANVDSDTVIVNTSATLLPETGGMGTTIFMIGGGIMMFAAVALLITKRRRANA